VIFEAEYDEIELQKINYGVISVTYSSLYRRKTLPK